MRQTFFFFTVSSAALCLPACQSLSAFPSKIDPNPNPNSIRSAPASQAHQPEGAGLTEPGMADAPGSSTPSAEMIYGNSRYFNSLEPSAQAPSGVAGEGESFLFRNTPLEAVLNEILGEAFGLSYSVQPGVSGNISIRLEGIKTAEEAVRSLDAALSLQGLEIVDSGSGFVVARAGQVKASSDTAVFLQAGEALPAGASLAVIQVRYGNVADVTSLARSMMSTDVIRYSDENRGLVVLGGSPEAVASASDLIKSLDVNWLSAVSTGLIPVANTTPSELAADLDPILSRMGGVSVVPLDRLQKLMVIARRRETLDQVREWISRLDQDARPQVMRDILVYEARYVNAEDLIELTDTSGAPGPGNFFDQTLGMPNSAGYSPETPVRQDLQADPGLYNRRASDSLYQNLSIRVDPGRNAIVARGAPDELQSLGELLSMLDKPKRQVLIEATIVEVSLTDGSSLGIQWDLVQDRLSATLSDTKTGDLSSLFPGLSISYINTDIGAVVNALASTNDVEVVSSPKMLVLNNETAKLQVGDQVPIITQSAVSVTDPGAPLVNSTTYRDTGVILTVTPRIRAGGMVEVDVSQEVSGVSETTTSDIDSPTISQRSIQSVLAVPDGATAVLGGLMSSTRSYTQTGVPILKDTPILGSAFRSTSHSERRTELVVLIEPTVIMPEETATDIPAQLRLALQRARDGMGS
jgi:general secretion pathway protein D